jgi:hypothetical protein
MKKITIILLGAIVFCNACMWNGHRVKGNGKVRTESKQFGDVTGVELHSSFDVYLIEGSPAGVRIEAEENIIPHIEMHVLNGVLNIEEEDNMWLRPRKPVKIYITSPGFSKIQVHSSGNVIGQTKITNDTKLDLSVSGSGEMKLDVDAPEIEASVSGSGEMHLSGDTKRIGGHVSGSGEIKAINLKSEEADLHVSGSGSIDVYASVKLDASISGSGDVRYKGEATVKSNVSGSGNLRKVN